MTGVSSMFLTPNRKLGFSLPPSPAPFTTPRPERRTSDLRWADGVSSTNRNEKDKEVNVQVVVRCRPLSDEEQRLNIQHAILCNEQRKEVTVLQSAIGRQLDKAFTFDRVFGPRAQQRSIYEHAISPIVHDVLEGFNCTVFAYGQTGTGKTYTMAGDIKSKSGELSADAGIIPRAVRQVFDILEAQKADYSMKVTFLELYNEDIIDLLAPEDCPRSMENKQRRPISLMEDGKGGAIIRGLEEEVVYCANDIYGLLERGSARRRTADTLLNTQSSRSHSVFSITIHIKEGAIGEHELIKCGRLNLVDLAGSENISRSGVRESRAREAGELNKSLLTLGRVITALVEHSGHVPYRDSKLTRLLRDSLGGKAKTCIIATISPSAYCIEETMSTLDYAYRAKGIRNKPEANQKLSKSVLLKDLYLEIERMKQDVKAAREKNGVYIPHEKFVQDEAEKKIMCEKINQLEFDLDLKRKQADRFQELYHTEKEKNLDLDCEIRKYKENLEATKMDCHVLQEDCRAKNQILKEKESMISKLLCSENAICEQARVLHSCLEEASRDISKLEHVIDNKIEVEVANKQLILEFRSQLDRSLQDLQKNIMESISQQHQLVKLMGEHSCFAIQRRSEVTKSLDSKIVKLRDIYSSGIAVMRKLANALDEKSLSNLEKLKSLLTSGTMTVENFLTTVASEAEEVLQEIEKSLAEQKQFLSFSIQQREEGLQRSLVATQIISKKSADFFQALENCVSRLMTIFEENHMQMSQQMANFQKAYQEKSIKDENEALEKIAGILSSLSLSKAKMLSEAISNANFTSFNGTRKLQTEISEINMVVSQVEKHWTGFMEKEETQIQENISSTAALQTAISNMLTDCFEKVTASMYCWRSTESSIGYLHREHGAYIGSFLEESVAASQNALKDLMTQMSSTDMEFEVGTHDLFQAVDDSMLLDHKSKEEMEPLTTKCLDQLVSLQDYHNNNVACIRDHTERCLTKDYKVDQLTRSTKKPPVASRIMESIEALRTSATDQLAAKIRLENNGKGKEVRDCQMPLETPRNPFAAIN